jgi:hypothetical protein
MQLSDLGLRKAGHILATAAILVIFGLSFRAFSALLDPTLNSDNAIHVLMAYNFQLPQDFYYWGQDRLGSIVPMLAHALMKILPIQPIVSVSIIQFSLLLFGFICFASLFKETISRLIFAFVWFLPLYPYRALVTIAQPYGPQLAFIGFATVLTNRLLERHIHYSQLKQCSYLSGIVLSLFISLWISDFSIITIFSFLILGIALTIRGTRASQQLAKPSVPEFKSLILLWISVLVSSGIGISFILFAKNNAARRRNYASFNTFEQVAQILSHQIKIFFESILFQSNNLWFSIFNICLLCLLIYIFSLSVLLIRDYLSNRNRSLMIGYLLKPSVWFYVFLSNSIMGYPLLVLSQWVYSSENVFGSRYFTFIYVSTWLAILFLREGLNQQTSNRLACLLLIGAIAGSLALPDYVYSFQRTESKYAELQSLKSLAPAGFIGDYWESYILCTADPANLKCTSYDRRGDDQPCLDQPDTQENIGRVRCTHCVDEVFDSPNVYLVKNKWFENFPREIQQFGRCLIPDGRPFRANGVTLSRYRERE